MPFDALAGKESPIESAIFTAAGIVTKLCCISRDYNCSLTITCWWLILPCLQESELATNAWLEQQAKAPQLDIQKIQRLSQKADRLAAERQNYQQALHHLQVTSHWICMHSKPPLDLKPALKVGTSVARLQDLDPVVDIDWVS